MSRLLPVPLATFVLAFLSLSAAASPLLQHRATSVEIDGFYNVTPGGGSWLTGNTGGDGGEPINVVISSDSDTAIQQQSIFLDFMYSINMAGECLGQHEGNIQTANLGDGNGVVNSTTLRYDYGDPSLGTCQETILGGNHLRYWKQNGSEAASNAWFMAVSYEKNLTYGHDIITPDGYASGRDWLTGNATASGGTKSPITNRTFTTTSTPMNGFIAANSSEDINHGIVYDGVVDVWVVKITSNGSAGGTASTTSGAIKIRESQTAVFLAALVVAGAATLL
ncbi:hypothetical protein MNV49_003265 [Pseudohyphozyma bogoriensis]|nr:hypothetical protein MNV49_003265 [Pseudohyphozyma bogoriensis]